MWTLACTAGTGDGLEGDLPQDVREGDPESDVLRPEHQAALGDDRPCHRQVTIPPIGECFRGDVDRKFGMFTYQKGGSVIRMMEGILGEATLTKGMSNYLTAMSYQPATEDDLFLYLEVITHM